MPVVCRRTRNVAAWRILPTSLRAGDAEPERRRLGSAAERVTIRRRSTNDFIRLRSVPTIRSLHRNVSIDSSSAMPGTWAMSPTTAWRSSSRHRPTSPARSTKKPSVTVTFRRPTSNTSNSFATCSSNAYACSSPADASPSTWPTSADVRTVRSRPTSRRFCRTIFGCSFVAKCCGSNSAAQQEIVRGGAFSAQATPSSATSASG